MSKNKIFLWDVCKKYNVCYRSYGEYVHNFEPRVPVLEGHYCTYFQNGMTIRDAVRFNWWKRDFDSLLAINAVPQFNTIRFINDHTSGLRPPMTQYDASAMPLWRCFKTPDHTPFDVKSCNVDLDEINLAENRWQEKREHLDFTDADRINDFEFNEIIWRAVKGLDSPCPPSVRGAFLINNK